MKHRASVHRIHRIEPICVECGQRGKMTSGSIIRPYRPEDAAKVYFACSCGAYVTCHPGTGIPAGRPGSTETRRLRYEAHLAFDARWKRLERSARASGYQRHKAYRWLARQLGIDEGDCHIGAFDADTCRRVIDICTQAEGRAA